MKSLRFRLTALFVLVFGVALTLIAHFSYLMFNVSQQQDFDEALYNHAVDVAEAISYDYFGNVSVQLYTQEELLKRSPYPVQRSLMQLRNSAGEVVARSPNIKNTEIPLSPVELAKAYSSRVLFSDFPYNGRNYRVVTYLVRKATLPVLILQIAAPPTAVEAASRRLRNLYFIIVPVSLLLSMIVGLLVTRGALRPVRQLTEETNAIGVGELSRRVGKPSGDPELIALAQTVNSLLERVQLSVQAHDRFVADASHQLKTPLAIVKGELDLLQSRSRTMEEFQQGLASASQEIAHLIRTVENLLLLAKTDAGREALFFGKARLDEIAMESVARMDKIAREKNVHLQLQLSPLEGQGDDYIDFLMDGDHELLGSMLQSLLENAIKFSPPQANCYVRLRELADRMIIEVQDQGPGIPPGEREAVFSRFHRDPLHSAHTQGSGLGLTIARRIAEVHGGTIHIEDAAPSGALFIVEMKKTS